MTSSIPQEILDSLTAVKGVFTSAKGPRVIQLQQDVNRIEQYLLSQTQKSIVELPSRNTVSVLGAIEEIASKIEANNQDETLFQFITESLQLNLHADRVVIYRFISPEKATAIAESKKSSYASLLAQTLPYNSFGLELFQNKLSVIPSVYELIPSQLQFWGNFQVSSGLLMPIIIEQEIWGIVKIHYCKAVKLVSTEEKNLLQQVGMMLKFFLKTRSVTAPSSEVSQFINPAEVYLATKINKTVHHSISSCQEVLKKLINLQQNNAIASQNIDRLATEYQKAEQLITPIQKLKEALEILSVNAAIQDIQQDSEEEFISIAQQVEIIASQAREAEIEIENWLQELRDVTNVLDRSIQPTESNLNIAVKSIEQTRKKLQEILK